MCKCKANDRDTCTCPHNSLAQTNAQTHRQIGHAGTQAPNAALILQTRTQDCGQGEGSCEHMCPGEDTLPSCNPPRHLMRRIFAQCTRACGSVYPHLHIILPNDDVLVCCYRLGRLQVLNAALPEHKTNPQCQGQSA